MGYEPGFSNRRRWLHSTPLGGAAPTSEFGGRRVEPPAGRATRTAPTEANLQEAIAAALQNLEADLGEGNISDASASWVIIEISGKHGGFAGLRGVTAKLTATRSPPWP
jgi:hypothetical protein